MNLLLESKRDNLLLPYYNLLLSKGLNISFGEFKSILLEHLTQNAGIRNLSLASNYYLAGAARYYFNGDLTENKDLALFYNYTTNNVRTQQANNNQVVSQNHQDKFIPEVCMALNVLIKILRDSYIDTIGTTFEQPEDFGELSLKQLFKKYGAKIKKQLGMEDKPEESTLNKSTKVGNGYTFEILYSFDQAKKYYEYTNPGAWCITYGEGHYNSYIRNLNIHYVIFRQNGFENIERIPETEKWKNSSNGYKKPQDTFGNSLIAVLQSNDSWEPIYITSRWNHGANDTGSVEADHAYTTAEFMQITGVNQADLERIYQIWVEEVNANKSRSELNKIKKDTLLSIKEAQLRINNGENITSLIDITQFAVGSIENVKKSVFIGELKDTSTRFIVDKSKIVFESIGDTNTVYFTGSRPGDIFAFNYLIVCKFENYYLLYDYRQHKIVSVNDVYKFKAIPVPFYYTKKNEFNSSFYQVKTSHKDIALIDINTNQPLQLPNGEYWFNSMFSQSDDRTWLPRNKVLASFVGNTSCSALEIIYDESSREKYFYNLTTRKFFNPPVFDGDESLLPVLNSTKKLEPILADINLGKNFIVFRFTTNPNGRWDSYCTPLQLFTTDGRGIVLDNSKYFKNLIYLGYNFLAYEKFEGQENEWYRIKRYKIFDFQNNTTITIGGKAILASGFKGVYTDALDRGIICEAFRAQGSFILDKKMRKLVKNNYKYPDENTFYFFMHDNLGSAFTCYKNNNVDYEYNDEAMARKTFVVDLEHQCTYETKLFDYRMPYNEKEIFNKKPLEYIEG